MVGLAAMGSILIAAEAFLAPVCLALVAGVILTPLSDFWDKLGLSRAVGATLNLAATLLLIGVLVLAFQPIVMRMIDEAPKVMADIESSMRGLRSTIRDLDDLKDDVAETVQTGETTPKPKPEDETENVTEDMPSVTDALFLAPALLAQIIIFAGTLFFFTATRDQIYVWACRALPSRDGRRMNTDELRRAERKVARYFVTITVINFSLAVATGAVLTAIGLPGAIQWGVVIFFMNYVVYLGPAIFGIALLFAGIASFDGLYALVPPVAFFGLNILEGQFVTPALVGREMEINPLIVFLSVTFGLWLWGPIGGIVVIPIIVWIQVVNTGLAKIDPPEEESRPEPAGAA